MVLEQSVQAYSESDILDISIFYFLTNLVYQKNLVSLDSEMFDLLRLQVPVPFTKQWWG